MVRAACTKNAVRWERKIESKSRLRTPVFPEIVHDTRLTVAPLLIHKPPPWTWRREKKRGFNNMQRKCAHRDRRKNENVEILTRKTLKYAFWTPTPKKYHNVRKHKQSRKPTKGNVARATRAQKHSALKENNRKEDSRHYHSHPIGHRDNTPPGTIRSRNANQTKHREENES